MADQERRECSGLRLFAGVGGGVHSYPPPPGGGWVGSEDEQPPPPRGGGWVGSEDGQPPPLPIELHPTVKYM
jgi:hypothetical protein